MRWSILKHNSWEGRECAAELRQINAQFKKTLRQKRHKGFRAVRDLRDARIASSQSISQRRAAIRAPWLLRSWMEHRLVPSPPAPQNDDDHHWGSGTGRGWGTTKDGGWGTIEWIDSADVWVGWGPDSPNPSSSWDGVTRTPKSSGKRKRQRRRRAQRRAAQAAAAAALSERLHVELVAAQRERFMVEILPELTPEDRASFMKLNLWTTT
ncbi:hypothetical protein K438DRAFT_2138342 [Mycena galopus ATCC 62051]|nr:hypothetical protein K438DRAFT_2138342 [Mycena galopus ATCC 62051]